MSCIFYKREQAWNLPSLSVGCIQVEALLRFAGAEFLTVIQTEPGRSPSGIHPAFEKDSKLAPTVEGMTEFDAMRSIQSVLKSSLCDVDSHLTKAQEAVMIAMLKLIEMDLEPATLHATWCEREGYNDYKKAYGGSLPFPLSALVPYMERRKMQSLFTKKDPDQIYAAANSALDCIANFLEERKSSDGFCCFGKEPCTLDAILLGHLLFYKLSPCFVPSLQRKIYRTEALMKYIDELSKKYFSDVVPTVPHSPLPFGVEEEAEMQTAWPSAPMNWEYWKSGWEFSEWKKLDKTSRWWLGGATVLLLGYAWMKPPLSVYFVEAGDMLDEENED